MTLIVLISTENAILCGSIMPIIAPYPFCKSLIYMDFIKLANDTFVARRQWFWRWTKLFAVSVKVKWFGQS